MMYCLASVQNNSWVVGCFSAFLWLPVRHSQSLFLVVMFSETGGNCHKSTCNVLLHTQATCQLLEWFSGSLAPERVNMEE